MTENSLVQDWIANMKANRAFRGAVIFKHADRFTSHIPDVEVLLADKASWVEVKYLRKDRRLIDIVEMGQLMKCCELYTVCGGRAWFLVYDEITKQTQMWRPRVLAGYLYPDLIIGERPNPLVVNPAEIELALYNFTPLLRAHGVLVVEGFNHHLPSRVIVDALTYVREA